LPGTGGDVEGEDAGADSTPEDGRFQSNKQSKSLVVCCDTMGSGRPFSIDQVATARSLVVAFTQGLSALSDAQFQVEMNVISQIHASKEEDSNQLTNQLEATQEESKKRFDAFLEENEEAPQEEKSMQEALIILEEHQKIVSAPWVASA
jgi:hypothetical protein